jgi:hypothetical protein
MTIPPPGPENAAAIAEFVDGLAIESTNDERRVIWLQEAERGLNLYLGNHFDGGATFGQASQVTPPGATPLPEAQSAEGRVKIVLNRIQNCIISLVAIQAGDPPKVTFTPRETGEQPLVFVNTENPQGTQLAEDLAGSGLVVPDPMTGEPRPWDQTEPLPDASAQMIQQQIQSDELLAAQLAAMGQPPPDGMLTKDAIVEVTDQTASQALQTIFDADWESADGNYIFCENILNKNVLGFQPTLYEYDDAEKRHILTNVHPKHVYVDPLNTDSSRWQYAIYDQPISADEAKCRWPQLADLIEANKAQGALQWPGSTRQDLASMYQNYFRRDMVVVRTAWLRYQPFPMTPEEAAAAGKIQTREVPDETQIQTAPNAGGTDAGGSADSVRPVSPNGDDRGGDAAPTDAAAGTAVQGLSAAPGGGGSDVAVPEGGQAALSVGDNADDLGAAPVQPTRQAHFLPDTGAEVAPGGPGWPVRYGIRQVTVVLQTTVDDRECELGDNLPLPANRNVPIPFSPYGQGEPKRLEGLQLAINSVLSDVVTHQRYNAYPPEFVPASVADRMDGVLRKIRSQPGKRYIIPDSLLTQFQDIKKIVMTLDVPALPTDVWKLLDLLIQLIDKEGNQSDVMQGNAAAGWSGETVQALQNAASQIIRGKSMFTEFYLKRVARLFVHTITTRYTPADLRRYLTKYPVQAIEAFHGKFKSLDVDVSVSIASGSGASKQSETNNLIAARQNGVPISDPTIMERLNIDPDAEQQKQMDWARKQQAGAGAVPMAAQAAAAGAPPAVNKGAQAGPAPQQGAPAQATANSRFGGE